MAVSLFFIIAIAAFCFVFKHIFTASKMSPCEADQKVCNEIKEDTVSSPVQNYEPSNTCAINANRLIIGAQVESLKQKVREELRSFCGSGLDRANFLLNPEYPVDELSPCTDFSPWVLSKVKKYDYESIIEFIREIQAQAGWEKEAIEKTVNNINKIKYIDFSDYLQYEEYSATYDLKAALCMCMLHNRFSFYFPSSRNFFYLPTVMLPYSFVIRDKERRLQETSALLKKMKRKANRGDASSSWTEIKPVKETDFTYSPSILTEWNIDRYKEMSFSARCHLFDIFSYDDFSNTVRDARELTLYETRHKGINTESTVNEIYQSGIFKIESDYLKILNTYTKQQLLDIESKYNTGVKKSAKKDVIAKAILESGEDIKKIINSKYIFKFTQKQKNAFYKTFNQCSKSYSVLMFIFE